MQPDLFLNNDPAPKGKTRMARCISLWQPWASLMACGAKFIETRHWDSQVRGEVFIHASMTKEGIKSVFDLPDPYILAMEKALGLKIGVWAATLPFGALVVRGNLTTVLPSGVALAKYPDQEPFGNFAPGRFGHLYENLTRIEPITCRGAQGFFFAEVPESAE